MYFNHAYQKTLINTGTGGFYSAAGDSTLDIPAGRVAVVNGLTVGARIANETVNLAAAAPTPVQMPMVYLAQGSINTLDKLGPFAGGYKETVKTKGINPKYVNRFFRVDPTCPQAEITSVCLCEGAAAQCGTSYYLRIDVKGSPALRFLTHNAYRTYASNNVCCPLDPNASTDIDAMQVQTSWAWQIARDPIMSNFILPILSWTIGTDETTFNASAWFAANPKSTDLDLYAYIQTNGNAFPYTDNGFTSEGDDYVAGTTSADAPCLKLVGSYVDTQFGTCSFHPQDFYELAPVKIYPSITDQQGDPCVDQIFCITKASDDVALAGVLGKQGSGYGHKLLRDAILFRRYMQEQYVYDPRLREVMNQDQVYTWIIGNSFYVTYGILHSVPRFNNPTSTFDNDQYLITIVQPVGVCGTTTGIDTNFQTWMNTYLSNAGNGVQLEILS
jgi:hypothetical protein